MKEQSKRTADLRWGIGSYAVAWSVGVQGYGAPESPLTIQGLLDLAADHQVPMIQICDNMPLHNLTRDDLEALAISAVEQNVGIEVGTRTYETAPLMEYLEIATQLGSPIVRTLLEGPATGTPDLLAEAEQCLRRILPEFERRSIALAIENCEAYPCSEIAALIDRIGSPWLGVCLDTVNSLGALEPLDDVIAVLAPHTISFHLKDFMVRRHPHTMGFEIIGAEPGAGALDSRSILERLLAAGREPSVVLELWPPFQGDVPATVSLERSWLETGIAYTRQLVS